jgi:hypothetical protein
MGMPDTIARILIDYITHRRLVACAIACLLYRMDHNEWPIDLWQLVPDYLPDVPMDPFSEGDFIQLIVDDHPRVFSVGRDGIDDFGSYEASRDQTLFLCDDPTPRFPLFTNPPKMPLREENGDDEGEVSESEEETEDSGADEDEIEN